MCPNKATFPGNWEACAGSEHPAQHSLRMCCWERAAPLFSLAAKAALHAVDMLVVVCSLPDAQECCFSKSEGGEDASPLEGLRWEKLCKSSSFILGAACSVSVRWNQTALQLYHCQNWKKRLNISPWGFQLYFVRRNEKMAKKHHVYFQNFSFTLFNTFTSCNKKIWWILQMKYLDEK